MSDTCTLCNGLGYVPKNIYTDSTASCPACGGDGTRTSQRRVHREMLDQARRDLRRGRMDDQERGAYEAAAREEAQHGRGDAQWEAEVRKILGDDIDVIADALRHAAETPEEVAAQDAWREAQKAMRGGWLFGPNKAKAKKIIKKNRTAIRNTVAKRKGCWLFTMTLLALPALVVRAVLRAVSR